MFWQAIFFSAANSAMAFYALSLGRPAAAAACIAASVAGCLFAGFVRKHVSESA